MFLFIIVQEVLKSVMVQISRNRKNLRLDNANNNLPPKIEYYRLPTIVCSENQKINGNDTIILIIVSYSNILVYRIFT